jgi:hypothetical protein
MARAKLLEVWARLTSAAPSAVVAVMADYEFEPADARGVLNRFVADLYPEISRSLGLEQ